MECLFFPHHKIPISYCEHWSFIFFNQFLHPLSSCTSIKSSHTKVQNSSSQCIPNTSKCHAIKSMHTKCVKIPCHLFQACVKYSCHALKVFKTNIYAKYFFHLPLCWTSFPSPFASHFVVVDQSSISSVKLSFFHSSHIEFVLPQAKSRKWVSIKMYFECTRHPCTWNKKEQSIYAVEEAECQHVHGRKERQMIIFTNVFLK